MKYFISELKYRMNEMAAPRPQDNRIYEELKTHGFVILSGFLKGPQALRDLVSQQFETQYIWQDSTGSDTRIHGIEKLIPEINTIFANDILVDIYRHYIDKRVNNGFIMANRVVYKENNLGSGGGWHRDLINRRQLKFILYLTDSNEESGCFQYLPGTHKVLKKHQINRFLKKQSSEVRYSEQDIGLLAEEGYLVKSLVGKAGDMIVVDTSGIHRGKPIESGERIALTSYMWDTEIPAHIKKVIVDLETA